MTKSKHSELDNYQITRIVSLALEEKKPFGLIQSEFGIVEKEVVEIMRKRLNPSEFEVWKKRVAPKKPAPKPDDFDEDLDGKYYIKNKFD